MEYCYSLKDFETIGTSQSVLTTDTVNIIKRLCEIIGVPNETSTFVNQYNSSGHVSNHSKSKDVEYKGDKYYKSKKTQKTADGWKSQAGTGFKVSKFAELNNNDAIISEIRTLMNKLTAANQESKIQTIREKFAELSEAIADDDENDDIKKAFATIYTITVSNTSYMDTYINLWNALYTDYQTEITDLIETKLTEYKASLHNIVDVDSQNYDEFCEFIAKNTTRKNTANFLCKLAKSETISAFTEDKIVLLLNAIISQIEENIQIKEKQVEVEQLTENAVIIFSAFRSLIEHHAPWLRQIIGYKTGEKPGLPPRSKFKFMDVIGK
jgi:hypothetical protein